VSNGQLRYYKNSKDAVRGKVLGELNVKDMECGPLQSMLPNYDYSFQIITPERTWLFVVESPKLFEAWKENITQVGGNWDDSLDKGIQDPSKHDKKLSSKLRASVK